jgi:hypothetical protein
LKRAYAKRHDYHKPEPTQPAVPIVASCREIPFLEAAWLIAPRAAGACEWQKSCKGYPSAREIIENASRDSSKR